MLGSCGPNAVLLLLRVLKNEEEEEVVREAAAKALYFVGDSRAVEGLLAVLGGENDVCLRAIEALGSIGDRRAVMPLIGVLEDLDAPSPARASAASALGSIGDARAIKPLVTALDCNIPAVRNNAAGALEEIGQPAVEALTAALGHEKEQVRTRAREVLKYIHEDQREVDTSGSGQ
jgi:HEAT repeat protein